MTVELSSIVDIVMRSVRTAAERDIIEKKMKVTRGKDIHQFPFDYLPQSAR